MLKYFFIGILLSFVCLFPAYSQEVLNISCEVMTFDNKAVEGAQITIYEGGLKVQSVTSDSKGNASFSLSYNKNYKVVVSKSGMIQKRVDFQTDLDQDKQITLRKEFAVTLVGDCDGADVSAFNEPADIIKYDKKEENFVSDESHFVKMQSKFAQAYKNLEECKNEKFDNKIQKADQLVIQGKYEEAIALYEDALEIYPNDGTTKRKIVKAQQSQEDAGNRDLEYDKYVKEGEKYLASKDFNNAKKSFLEAQKIKPNESLPGTKISQIDAALAKQTEALQKQNAEEDEFKSLVAKGNSAMAEQNYALAKQLFDKAAALKPSDYSVQQRSADAQKGLEMQQQKQAEQERINKEYEALIAQGQEAMQKGNYEDAENQFQSALALKPQEATPRKKIKEVQELEAERKKRLLAQQKEDNQRGYDQAIAQANSLMKQKDYADAIASFEKALKYKPTDTYAQKQIGQINNLIVEESQAKKVAIENQYNQAMIQGDAKKVDRKFAEAIESYQQALEVKPSDPEASKKLAEAQRLLADQQRIEKEEKVKRAEYEKLVTEADDLFKAKDLRASMAKYEKALVLYSAEQYPKNQIAKIENIEKREKLEGEYNQIIAAADGLFEQKKWDEAKAKYNQAISVFPEKTYPQNQINEIKKNLSLETRDAIEKEFKDLMSQAEIQVTQKNYAEAKGLFAQAQKVQPENSYPQKRINEINLLIDEIEKQKIQDQYDELITKADDLFEGNDYSAAKEAYKRAIAVLPNEKYPQKQLNTISNLQSENSRKKVQSQYSELLAEADNFFDQEAYEQATKTYKSALDIFPEESYPQQKINEISAILTERERLKAEKETLEQNYSNTITLADKYFKDKNYQLAKEEYNKALKIKTSEEYPINQIKVINRLVAEEEAIKTELLAQENSYKAAIVKADGLFKARSYNEAKSEYEKALSLKANDVHSSSQIKRIDQLLSAEAIKQQKEEEKKAKYEQFISGGDKFYAVNQLNEAKKAYAGALEIIPGQEYPRTQIRKIDERLRSLAANQSSLTAVKSQTPLTSEESTSNKNKAKNELSDFDFKTDDERQLYLEGLRGKYKEGITKEVHQINSGTVTRYIVIRDGEVNEYRETRFKWGGAQYKVNGKPSNLYYLKQQVKPRDGENFTEIK